MAGRKSNPEDYFQRGIVHATCKTDSWYKKKPTTCVACAKSRGAIMRQKYRGTYEKPEVIDVKAEKIWKKCNPDYSNEAYL